MERANIARIDRARPQWEREREERLVYREYSGERRRHRNPDPVVASDETNAPSGMPGSAPA
jgi:hypothetical protein